MNLVLFCVWEDTNSGLIEIIALRWTSAIWSQYPVLSPPGSPQGIHSWEWLQHSLSILRSLNTHLQRACNAIALSIQHSLFTDKTGNSFYSHMHMWGIYYNKIFFLFINLSFIKKNVNQDLRRVEEKWFFLTYTLKTWVFKECCHPKINRVIWSCSRELVSWKKTSWSINW